MKKTSLLGLATILILSGCGGSNTTENTSPTIDDQLTQTEDTINNINDTLIEDIGNIDLSSYSFVATVERGKVYDTCVFDSSQPVQIASQIGDTNKYAFANNPTLPIMANGGWIDINGNGKKDIGVDIELQTTLKSRTNNITVVSTYIEDNNETVRENKLKSLQEILQKSYPDKNISTDELLKLPSDAPIEVAALSNAIYKEKIESGYRTQYIDLNNIQNQFNEISQYITDTSNYLSIEQSVVDTLKLEGLIETVPESNPYFKIPEDKYIDVSLYANIDNDTCMQYASRTEYNLQLAKTFYTEEYGIFEYQYTEASETCDSFKDAMNCDTVYQSNTGTGTCMLFYIFPQSRLNR